MTTARDAWVYGFSEADVVANVGRSIAVFNTQLGVAPKDRENDPRQISWSDGLLAALSRGERLTFEGTDLGLSTYRPYCREHLYFNRDLNERRSMLTKLYPGLNTTNLAISVSGVGASAPFASLMLDTIPNIHIPGAGNPSHCLPRWTYTAVDGDSLLDLGDGEVVDGYRRIDNITDQALKQFAAAYPGDSIIKDDIFFYVYGLLHSPEYRETYAADLKKMLPRVPFVEDFRGYAEAGRRLSDLHLGYESVARYPLDGLDPAPPAGVDPYDFYRVRKMRFPKKGERGSIVYNEHITVSGIPEDVYRYMLGSRSAVEWIIDRYQVKADKPSGIVNDPNDWSREVGDPRYILDLLARIVTVSLETMRVVDSLPPLSILSSHTNG